MSENNTYFEVIQNRLDTLVDKIIQKEQTDEDFRITYAQILEKINTKMDLFSNSDTSEEIRTLGQEIGQLLQRRQEILDAKFLAIKSEFENLNKEKIDNNIYVTSKLVEHGKLKPAYGFIINIQGHTIGVSGDSRICESIFEIVDKSEISILDMSAIDMKTNAHMNLYDIKELCYKYKNKTIIATHMHDYTREKAKEEKIDNLIIPEDGQIIKV